MEKSNKPQRMSAYVRVSRVMGREGESYISPDVQREAVEAWAKSRGVEIVAVDVDEDQSGGTQDRPGLRTAIKRIEDGKSDGIIVHKLNRFARNVRGGIEDIERIRAAGGTIGFVEEGIDPTGPFGEFLLTMLLAVAELELGNVKQSWQVAKDRALDRGVPIGPTPFGYVRAEGTEEGSPSVGSLLAHPEYGPVVTETFRRAAAGDTLHAALAYIEKHAGDERTWTTTTLRRFLSQTVYLGVIQYGDRIIPDAHEPLTTRAIFDLANRHEATERARKGNYTLSGFAVCAGCGDPMVGAGTGSKTGTLRTYRCRNYAKKQAKKDCPAPAMVVASNLEVHVLAAACDAGVMVPTLFAPSGEETPTEVDAVEVAAARVRAARTVLEELEQSTEAQRILGLDRWLAQVEQRKSELQAAEVEYEEASGQAAENVGETLDVLMPLGQILEAAANGDIPDEAPFIFAKKAIRSLRVKKGKGSLHDRVTIEWAEFPKDPRPDEPLTALGKHS